MIRIVAPVSSVNDTERVIAAGANEVYAGVLTSSWKRQYLNVAAANRREYSAANLRSYPELARVVSAAHRKRIPVAVTFNSFYSERQYPAVVTELNLALKTGVDAVIAADLGLICRLRKMRTPIHLSSGATVFNSLALDFYRAQGVSRVILPRHLAIPEIRRLSNSKKGLEIEVFIQNTRCINIDGFCTFLHGLPEISILGRIAKRMRMDYLAMTAAERAPWMKKYLSRLFGSTSACSLDYAIEGAVEGNYALSSLFGPKPVNHCGACALYDLNAVDCIKIVGRENPSEKKARDVTFMRRVRDSLKPSVSRTRFTAHAKRLFKETYGYSCRNCYYPEWKKRST
ncbi:MAG: U32 family peptidase [archaeon]